MSRRWERGRNGDRKIAGRQVVFNSSALYRDHAHTARTSLTMARTRKTASPAPANATPANLNTLDRAKPGGEMLGHDGEAGSWLERYSRWRDYYVLIPVVLALLVSLPNLKNGFAYDDKEIISNGLIK